MHALEATPHWWPPNHTAHAVVGWHTAKSRLTNIKLDLQLVKLQLTPAEAYRLADMLVDAAEYADRKNDELRLHRYRLKNDRAYAEHYRQNWHTLVKSEATKREHGIP